MRTVTFQSVMHGAARLLGMDPAGSEFNARAMARLVEYIQARYEEALVREFWPELTLVEERTPDTDKLIEYEQAGQTAIGEVKTVSQRNPNTSNFPGYIKWWPSADGIQLVNTAPETVFVKFRVRPNTWTSTLWAAGSHAAGVVRYYSGDGECYIALQTTTVTPGTDAAHWRKLDFPRIFAPFVKRAAAADGLGDVKQNSRKRAELDQAYQDLADAQDAAMASQGQYDSIEVDGYGR